MKRIYYILLSTVLMGAFPVIAAAQANEEINYLGNNNMVILDKSLAPAENGEYLLTLESFVQGSKEVTESGTRTPMDFSLVFDLSGSMGRTISGSDYFPCPDMIEVSHDSTKFRKFDLSCGWSKTDGDYHPAFFALYSRNSNSPLYYRDNSGAEPVYRMIYRKKGNYPNGCKALGLPQGTYYYYIFFETEETFTDPFDGKTYNKRYFLGKDLDGTYHARYFGPAVYPCVLKEGKTEGSNNPEDYQPAPGVYFSTDPDQVLYKSNEFYTQSRLDALRGAVKSFLSIVKSDDQEYLPSAGPHHRVGIVKFASELNETVGNNLYHEAEVSNQLALSNYSQIVYGLSDISSNESGLADMVDQLMAGGRTRTNLGLQLARTMLSDTGTNRVKNIVLFTDGEPTTNSNFETKVANSALTEALSLKQSGAKIYVVGLTSESTDNALKFMNYVSSNYESASSMDTPGEQTSSEYMFLATTGEDLKNIFSAIAKNASTKIGYELHAENSSVLDVLTEDFLLPVDVTPQDPSRIKVYTEELASCSGSTYTFDGSTRTPLDDATVNISGLKNNEIIVKGFDFSENWCGPSILHRGSGVDETTYHGKKLIVTIPIRVNPESDGGADLPTNESNSGVYSTKSSSAVNYYPVPKLSLTNLQIVKNGMLDGDRALFRVYRLDKDGKSYDADFKPITVSVISKETIGSARVTLLLERKYTVEEITSWSWAYKPTSATKVTKELKATNNPSTNVTVFDFSNVINTEIRHAESSAVNEFSAK